MAAPDYDLEELALIKGRLRPINAIGPIAGSVFTVLAWAAIAHNSGSGWVQALGAMLGAVLLVGLVAPARFVARARVEVAAAPMDAVAGQPIELEVTSTTRVRIRPVLPEGTSALIGAANSEQPTLRVVPKRRGILVAVTVDIASAAPFGILWWSRRTTLALPIEVCVAPRPTTPLWVPPELDDQNGDSQSRRSGQVGEPRGVRDYQHGDSRRSVHWRASAHTGRLMVREMEIPTAEPVTIRIELPAERAAADALAGQALATVLGLIERARPVMLATHEPNGDRLALVATPREAGRRLARAVAFGTSNGSVTIDDPNTRDPGRGSAQTQRVFPAIHGPAGAAS